MKSVKVGKDTEGLQGNQLRKGREGCIASGIRKARELWYWEQLDSGTERVGRRGLLFVRMAIETFERSMLKPPPQVPSCIHPPVTRMEGMVV